MTISLSRVFYMIPEPDPDDEEANSSEEHKQILFDNEGSSCLSKLHEHNCLVNILDFLSFTDMNSFSRVSKECYNVRCHKHLDQTRSGTICLGKGVQSIVELMLKVREEEWHKSFRGNRTHLHLAGLNSLSSDIESIDEQFIKQCSPLKGVTSLDCSEVHLGGSNSSLSSSSEDYEDSSSSSEGDDVHGTDTSSDRRQTAAPQSSSSSSSSGSSWLFRYQDYIDKGFAHGLALSLLVPNLREIDMSYLPLTSLGVAWIAENNPKLERIRWNRSLIWPINHHAYDILRACRNLKELYIDDARLLFGSGRSRRRRRQQRRERQEQQRQLEDPDIHGNNNANGFRRNVGQNDQENNNNNNNNEESDALWASLTENVQSLVKVSCRRARWYNQNSKFITIGETEEGQASLMRFVRSAGNLKWFRSDLTDENIAILAKERPDVVFCH